MYLGGHNKNHSEDRENGTREQQNIEVAMMISQNISIPTLEGLGQNPNQKEKLYFSWNKDEINSRNKRYRVVQTINQSKIRIIIILFIKHRIGLYTVIVFLVLATIFHLNSTSTKYCEIDQNNASVNKPICKG